MEIKSRLLKQLDKDIAAAKSPVPAACLKARRAILLARHGALNEAREQLTVLHQLAFQHPHPEVGAWLHLAEGLMNYYTDFGSSAQEKIQRALSISRSIGQTEVEALAHAWLTQLAYVRHDLPVVLSHAAECMRVAAPEHHVARGRVHMVMGVCWQYAGQLDQALPWFQRSRAYAAADGDDATISALMYNMAVMRTAQVRWKALSSTAALAPELLLGVDSVKHYDAAVGAAVLAELTPLLRAQILAIQGDFPQAKALYEEHLPLAISRGLARLGSSLLSDLAWCRLNCDETEAAVQQAREAAVELDPLCDVDDRAATHTRLAQIFAAVGETAAAAHHQERAAAEWAEFARQQQEWGEALGASGLKADPLRR